MYTGCIGETLKHSFSCEIHALLGDYKYELKELSESELQGFFDVRDFHAINVTIPYKKAVIPYLDKISDEARKIGAVNTIVNRGGKLLGYNTDYFGLLALIKKAGVEVSGKTVLVLGSGGTSNTANCVLSDLGAKEVVTVSRTKTQTNITYEEMYENYLHAEVIVNTTPVGMYPNEDGIPVDLEQFKNLHGVIDAVYNPLQTNLILKAKERGLHALDGLYMLVAQAAYAAEKFFGDSIYLEKIDEVYSKVKDQKLNFVLIGMPSCGKTTLGTRLAQKLCLSFIDTDDCFFEKTNFTAGDYIKAQGEDSFRKIESEIINEVSKINAQVIATGGGAVLNPNNVTALKRNGIIIFIDRDIDKLITTPDRPLSSDKEKLESLYTVRHPIYLNAADIVFKPQDDINTNINNLIKLLGK